MAESYIVRKGGGSVQVVNHSYINTPSYLIKYPAVSGRLATQLSVSVLTQNNDYVVVSPSFQNTVVALSYHRNNLAFASVSENIAAGFTYSQNHTIPKDDNRYFYFMSSSLNGNFLQSRVIANHQLVLSASVPFGQPAGIYVTDNTINKMMILPQGTLNVRIHHKNNLAFVTNTANFSTSANGLTLIGGDGANGFIKYTNANNGRLVIARADLNSATVSTVVATPSDATNFYISGATVTKSYIIIPIKDGDRVYRASLYHKSNGTFINNFNLALYPGTNNATSISVGTESGVRINEDDDYTYILNYNSFTPTFYNFFNTPANSVSIAYVYNIATNTYTVRDFPIQGSGNLLSYSNNKLYLQAGNPGFNWYELNASPTKVVIKGEEYYKI